MIAYNIFEVESMIRSDFDDLNVMKQIEYINGKLTEGDTLTELCKNIGISRSTIRDRFKKVSYEYNKSINQYEYIVEIIEDKKEVSCETIEVIEKDTILVKDIDLKDNEILTSIIHNYNEINNKLNEMYSWYKLQSSNKVVATDSFKVDDFEGDIVVRSFKLYENIQKEFLEFCKKNNKYKVQDILSQALKEFLDKYNK